MSLADQPVDSRDGIAYLISWARRGGWVLMPRHRDIADKYGVEHDGVIFNDPLPLDGPPIMTPKMTLADYAEAGVAPPELVEALECGHPDGTCETCGAHDSEAGLMCEGCGDCQTCCNCQDTDCDCDACTERRGNQDDE